MVDNDRVLELIRQKGPIVPNQLLTDMKLNSIIMGAVLSSLAAQKKVVISALKVGGSPLYYLPDQREMLESFTKSLKEQDRACQELLKERKVMRDSELTPLLRVSMRNLRDFAKPLEVTLGEAKEIFWKYYLVSDDDATAMIGRILEPKKAEKSEAKSQAKPIQKTAETQGTETEEMISEQTILPTLPPDRLKRQKKEDFILEEKGPSINDAFHTKLTEFFEQSKIAVVEARLIKRNSEMEYVLDVPSAIGTIEFFCKAKSKKTINEGDLSTAFIAGQHRKLPTLFLTVGSLNKKAQDMLGREFKGMVVKRVG
jgi:hypothetical protein